MNIIDITILLLFSLSMIFLFFIGIVYLKYRLLIKHPNNIFFIVVTLQVLEMLSILITSFTLGHLPLYSKFSGPVPLQILQYFTRFCKVCAFHYIVSINLEIFIKLRKSMIIKFKTRVLFYNIYNPIASCLITIFARESGDSILGYFKVVRIIYVCYLLVLCIMLLCIVIYLFARLRGKLRSKDMISLTILTLITVFIAVLQVIIGVLDSYKFNKMEVVDKLSYFLNSLEGVIEITVFYFSKKMKNYMKETLFYCRRDGRKNSENMSLVSLLDDPLKFKISGGNLDFFSDIFDNLTTSTLIKILVSATLRFSKHESHEAHKIEFNFTLVDLLCLYEKTHLEFLKSINPKILAVTDYEFSTLSKIREKYLKNSIYSSLVKVSNYYKIINSNSEKGGRSSSYVFITTDQQFVLKTITKHEFKIFQKNLIEQYASRVLNCEDSRLVRIFAVLFLNQLDQYVLVMENLVYKREDTFVFDLKGSKIGRTVEGIGNVLDPPKGEVLKDLNFEQFGYKISLEDKDKEQIFSTLIEDFRVLKNCGIMDYSILLGLRRDMVRKDDSRTCFVDLEGFVVSIGIIDVFQEYNIKKIGENAVKTFFNKTRDVSSIDPEQYFERISEYLRIVFL